MSNINQVNFFKTNKSELSGKLSMDVQETKGASFKDTMANMVNEMNEVTNKPDKLMVDAVQGKADIHDVMIAVAQSELLVQTVTTVTGKILQTYEKIMQIQI